MTIDVLSSTFFKWCTRIDIVSLFLALCNAFLDFSLKTFRTADIELFTSFLQSHFQICPILNQDAVGI